MNDLKPVRQIFNEALDREDPVARARYLAKACGANAALRQQVERLLQTHDEARGLPKAKAAPAPVSLDDTTVSGSDPGRVAPVAEGLGTLIGRYKLLENIGEGGFGVVYVAEQREPVRRRVAVKVIKLGMDTKVVVARFEAERQALALMDHPNIARVLDAGATDSGRPYFVMELVRGIRITDYCDQANLNTRERIELFIKVCQAIQHAHQKGIIHRDIKPSNILVTLHDGVPVPKVIDFGIAKATEGRLTEATVYTQLNQFIGTPAYMSPEQAEMSGLDVDTRSDIYSLGVLLYELLSGSTPFDGKALVASGVDAMRKTIREQEPMRPSTRLATLQGEELTTAARRRAADAPKLIGLLRGDLDWIVMKALEKDRTRRYETANGLSMDLRRYLANEPVLAGPPSASYRFAKFARRNQFALGVAAAIVAILVLATVISVWQAVRATTAEALASTRLTESEKARQEAEAIATFLADVFQSPDPARDGRTITVAETLGRAARQLETDLASQPARRARLQATLGGTYHALGLAREASPLREQARDYYLTTLGPEHPSSLTAVNNLASSYHVIGRRAEALQLREEVLRLRRKVLGPEHPDTLGAMHNLAVSYDDAGRRDEALTLREQVLALRRKVNGPEHPDTLNAMTALSLSYDAAVRRAEALQLKEAVLALSRKVNGPEHPATLRAMHNLANSYADAGRSREALALKEEVLALNRRVNGPEHPNTLTAMSSLALTYADTGRRTEALKLQEEVLALNRRVYGPEHPATLTAMSSLAVSYAVAGRRDEALKLRAAVLPLSRKTLGPEHPDTLLAMNNLAISYFHAGRRDEALAMQEEALSLYRRTVGPEHPDTLATMTGLANSYDEAGRQNEALALREEVLRLRRKVNGPEHLGTISALNNLANSYSKAGRRDEALTLREQLLPLCRRGLGPEHPTTLAAQHNLSVSYREAGRLDEAIQMGQASLESFRKVSGATSPSTLNAMTELAISQRVAGHVEQAIGLEEEALKLKRQHLPAGHAMTLESLDNLATCYEKSGQSEKAVPLRQELADLKARDSGVAKP